MSVPVAVRWNKWRMWRQKDGTWLAQQPFQIKDPMFKHRSSSGETWPVFSYKHRDASRVLHEMQLAMAKASAHVDGPRVVFTATNGEPLTPGVKVVVKRGTFKDREGIVRRVRKEGHMRSRFSHEEGILPILVEHDGNLMDLYYGPDDLEVIE